MILELSYHLKHKKKTVQANSRFLNTVKKKNNPQANIELAIHETNTQRSNPIVHFCQKSAVLAIILTLVFKLLPELKMASPSQKCPTCLSSHCSEIFKKIQNHRDFIELCISLTLQSTEHLYFPKNSLGIVNTLCLLGSAFILIMLQNQPYWTQKKTSDQTQKKTPKIQTRTFKDLETIARNYNVVWGLFLPLTEPAFLK